MAEGTLHYSIQTPLHCGICEGYEDVSWFCQNCVGRLCTSCKAHHRDLGPIFKNHTIVSIDDAIKQLGHTSSEEKCNEHNEFDFILYCYNCWKLVCDECIENQQHAEHRLGKIATIIEKVEKEIKEFHTTLKHIHLANCETEETNTDRDIQSCLLWYSSLESEVKKKQSHLKDEIDNICDDLLQKATKVKDKNMEKMTKQKQDLKDKKKEIAHLVTSSGEILTKSNSRKIQYNKEKPQINDLSVQLSSSPRLPIYKSGKINRDQITEQVGFLQDQPDELQVPHSITKPMIADPQVSLSIITPVTTQAPVITTIAQVSSPVIQTDTQVSLPVKSPVTTATQVSLPVKSPVTTVTQVSLPVKSPVTTDTQVSLPITTTATTNSQVSLPVITTDSQLLLPVRATEAQVLLPVTKTDAQVSLPITTSVTTNSQVSLSVITTDAQVSLPVITTNTQVSLQVVDPGLDNPHPVPTPVDVISSFNYTISIDRVCTGINCVCIVDSSSKVIQLLNMTGKIIHTIYIDEKWKIDDLTLNDSGDIIAVNYSKRCIRKILQSGQIVQIISTDPWFPTGICLANNHQDTVISMSSSNKSIGKLVIYNPEGDVKNQITVQYSDESAGNKRHQRIIQTYTGDYCIVHRGHRVVYVLYRSGSLKFTYNGSGAEQMKETFSPYDICCDTFNHLLISDNSNHTVHMVDQSGKLLKFLMTERDPTGLAIDKEGKLWLAQHDVMLILKYLK